MSSHLNKPFREKEIVLKLKELIRKDAINKEYSFMHVCGTHENIVSHYGIRKILPNNIRIIAGPGCPVCVCGASDIDFAINISKIDNTVLCIFGDMYRVPGTNNTLEAGESSNIKVVYSPFDALKIAQNNSDKNIVFFAVGFETTAVGIGALIKREPPRNFFIIPSLKIMPPILELLLGIGDIKIDGFILPGHVLTVMGTADYKMFADNYNMAEAVAGFEPVDFLYAIHMLIMQKNAESFRVDNAYTRLVRDEGNRVAQETLYSVFDIKSVNWRGIGVVPNSGLELKEKYFNYSAYSVFKEVIPTSSTDIHPGCICHLVMLGSKEPHECSMFGKKCTLDYPYGPCMVGNEGTCRIRLKYGQ